MPKRWTKREYRTIYAFLVKRDGEKCQQETVDCKGNLQIDHIDNDKENDGMENLQFLCGSHNSKKGNVFRWGTVSVPVATVTQTNPKANHAYETPPDLSGALRERERERDSENRIDLGFLSPGLKDHFGYGDGTPELKANNHYEIRYESFLLGKLRHDGYIRKEDAINAAAQRIQCSTLTAQRYWAKITSSEGWLAMNVRRFSYPVWELKAQVIKELARSEDQEQVRAQRKVVPIRKEEKKK